MVCAMSMLSYYSVLYTLYLILFSLVSQLFFNKYGHGSKRCSHRSYTISPRSRQCGSKPFSQDTHIHIRFTKPCFFTTTDNIKEKGKKSRTRFYLPQCNCSQQFFLFFFYNFFFSCSCYSCCCFLSRKKSHGTFETMLSHYLCRIIFFLLVLLLLLLLLLCSYFCLTFSQIYDVIPQIIFIFFILSHRSLSLSLFPFFY